MSKTTATKERAVYVEPLIEAVMLSEPILASSAEGSTEQYESQGDYEW